MYFTVRCKILDELELVLTKPDDMSIRSATISSYIIQFLESIWQL